MAKPKKATKTRMKDRKKKLAVSPGPERSRVKDVAPPREEQFILEEAREVREKRHPRFTKEEIVAIGLAKSRGANPPMRGRGPKGKSRVKEQSANAYKKSVGPVMGRKKSTARKSGMGSGHRRGSQP